MKCHKCPHLEAIQRGEYDSESWKDTPCAKCRLGEDTFYSVPYDDEYPPLSVIDAAAGSSATGIGSPSTEEVLPVSVISQFMQGFLSLEPCLRDIVVWRYQGLTYKEIAEQQGTSVQLAEMRHKRALRDWPALKALFPLKMARQARRKSRR